MLWGPIVSFVVVTVMHNTLKTVLRLVTMNSGNATALIFALLSLLLSPSIIRRLRSAAANTKIRGPKSPSFAVGKYFKCALYSKR